MRIPKRLIWAIFSRFGEGVPAARRLGVTVGEDCRVLSGDFSSEPWLVKIGDRVTVSIGCRFMTHDGIGWLFRDEKGRRYRYGPISVGSDSFIGAGASVMPGVTIGERCIIGAGSVVTKDIPAGSVAVGNPARVLEQTYDSVRRRVLAEWPSESEMTGTTLRERVQSVLDLQQARSAVRTTSG